METRRFNSTKPHSVRQFSDTLEVNKVSPGFRSRAPNFFRATEAPAMAYGARPPRVSPRSRIELFVDDPVAVHRRVVEAKAVKRARYAKRPQARTRSNVCCNALWLIHSGTCGSSGKFPNDDLSRDRGIIVSANRRPLSVTILACIYIAVGTLGFAYHLSPIRTNGFHYEDVLIELTELAAIVGGAFMLRGDNWARSLVVAWIGVHVIVSFFDSLQQVVVHGFFFVLIVYLLFRREARAYFQRSDQMGT